MLPRLSYLTPVRYLPSLLVVASSICACSSIPAPIATTCPPCAQAGDTGPVKSNVDAVAEEVVRRLQADDGAGLFALFGTHMQQTFPVDRVRSFVSGVLAGKGTIVSSTRIPGDGSPTRGEYRLTADKGSWSMELAADQGGRIQGLKITPLTDAEPPIARSEIPLGLPFRGEWSVHWGGDRKELNHHMADPSQRRAADLGQVGPDGKTYRGSGTSNFDYYAYGQEIVAVADGKVITVVDGVPDNVPGSENPYMTTGNVIVIQHDPTLYSVYAHLQPGSARVKVGNVVKRGATLGLCGNSGNSNEPHLHFQLQDGPLIEKSWGVTPIFANVSVVHEGTTTTMNDYTFLKGDRVRSLGP
jgi:murein DD-endopeptidase MepM/ murein hydrolase activator NlpD